MKIAIIYRSNANLDAQLAGLKGEVSLFHAFPAGTDKETIEAFCLTVLDASFEKVICDLTSYVAVRRTLYNNGGEAVISVIKQADGPLQDHIASVVDQAKATGREIAIVRDCLAHHCELDGIDPYSIGDGRNGWYFDKVLSIWESHLSAAEIPFTIVGRDTAVEEMVGKVVVCDHHNETWMPELHVAENEGKLVIINSYAPCGEHYVDVSDVRELMSE